MVSVKKHYDEIDIYKGIAMLLIILGHCFCSHPVDFGESGFIGVQSFIASFNLNMFFIASGILFSVKDKWVTFLRKKVQRLLLPWFAFILLSLFLRYIFSTYTHGHVDNVFREIFLSILCGKYYWFLYALFVMMVITKLIRNRYVLAILGVGMLVFQSIIIDFAPNPNVLCASRIVHYYPWFIIGFLLKNIYPTMREQMCDRQSCLIFIFLFVLLLAINTLVPLWVNLYIMPLLGCIAFWYLSVALLNINDLRKVFSFIGRYSLQYYLNHLLIMLPLYYVGALVFSSSPLLALTLIFIMAIIVSSIMIIIERKMPYVNKVCGFV